MIYELIMSKGEKIRIDQEDLEKLQANSSSFMVVLKQAMVRPPFVVAVLPTSESEKMEKVEIIDGKPRITSDMKKLTDLMRIDKYKKLN